MTRIEKQSFRASDYPISEKLFSFLINNRKFTMCVAVSYDIVVGYVCSLLHKRKCLVYSIAVDEAHRGLGIGKKLIETVERCALDFGAEKVSLDVRCDNNAVKLYDRSGYIVKEIKRKYYGDGGDAFHMEKILVPNRGDFFGTFYINAERSHQTIN